jgi:hypothetical protein
MATLVHRIKINLLEREYGGRERSHYTETLLTVFSAPHEKFDLRRKSMLDRKESKMLSTRRKSTGLLAGIVSVAMLSVGFAATGALSASADGGPSPQSAGNKQFAVSIWHRHTASRNFRYFGYAAPGSVPIPDNSVPDDGCDLPSTGCRNYLAN